MQIYHIVNIISLRSFSSFLEGKLIFTAGYGNKYRKQEMKKNEDGLLMV